jgi:hypothetical protein
MSRLVAHFDVKLPGQCLVVSRVVQHPFNCTINDFEVTVQGFGLKSIMKAVQDQHWTYVIKRAVVKVARYEDEDPPTVIPDEQGQLDYTVQGEYFSNRIGEYGAAACDAVNRFIRFFKFKMRTPFLQELPSTHDSFRNAEWNDTSGALVGKGHLVFVAHAVPGLRGELGAQKLRQESAEALQMALVNPVEPALYEEILSDAQTAIFEGNLRRAVLELAIASELVVEQKFLSGDSPAVAAFEYLEETARFRVRVVDFIHRVAQKAFGKSFRQDHRNDYDNIDHLFQCRNKIAHMGKLSYRDQQNVITVDYEIVAHWWDSVIRLIDWLDSLR